MKKLFLAIVFLMGICLLSGNVIYADKAVTYDVFARKLARMKGIHSEEIKNSSYDEICSLLNKDGIVPEGGWKEKENETVDKIEIGKLVTKALRMDVEMPSGNKGKVTILKTEGQGKCMAQKADTTEDEWVNGTVNMHIKAIKTDDACSVILGCDTESVIRIEPDTEIKIEPDKANLIKGEMTLDMRVTRKKPYQVFTPSGICAVRGTILNIKVGETVQQTDYLEDISKVN